MVSTAEGGTKRAWADGPFELISISSLGYEVRLDYAAFTG